jgi:hypothetical protein
MRHRPDAQLCVVCLDGETRNALERMNLPRLHLFTLEDLERYEPRLLTAKANRSMLEYFYTLSPIISLFMLDTLPDADAITYVDSDLYFFNDPEPLFEELGNKAVSIIGHRFPQRLSHLAKFGIYNVAWLTFRRDERAFTCLNWWRERCLEWCHDYLDGNRYADQKYLDDWPERFQGVVVLQHKGANVAPWNLANYAVTAGNGDVLIDNSPLLFFHFHRFRQVSANVYDTHLAPYGAKVSPAVRKAIFEPYIRAVRSLTERAQEVLPGIAFDLGLRHQDTVMVRLKRFVRTCQKLLNRDFIYFRDSQ